MIRTNEFPKEMGFIILNSPVFMKRQKREIRPPYLAIKKPKQLASAMIYDQKSAEISWQQANAQDEAIQQFQADRVSTFTEAVQIIYQLTLS